MESFVIKKVTQRIAKKKKSSLFLFLEIGKKESARETKLVLFPIQKHLYEEIKNSAKNLVEISKEMVESRWEVPIQFLSYVREER